MSTRLLFAVPLAFLGAAIFYWLALPWPILLRWRDPGATAFMERRLAEARAEDDDLALRYDFVPLDDIAPALRRAVIVAEDGNFERHHGIDWGALAEELNYKGDADFSPFSPADVRAAFAALGYYVRNRDEVRGRSTITQQLAKNLYFSSERSLLRKFDELVVARRLEDFLSKDRILELYLNVAEWGPGVFGAEAAAHYYFDEPASALSRFQAASLAATLPHPLTSNPRTRPGRMAWRRDLILARMGGRGPVRTVPLAPEPEAVEIDVPEIAPPSVARDTTIRDTTVSDTLPTDTLRPPPPDTTRPRTDTVRPPPDTTVRIDTLEAAPHGRGGPRRPRAALTTSD